MSVNIQGNHDCFQFTDRNLPYGIRHLTFFLFETLCKGCRGLSGNPTSRRTPCDSHGKPGWLPIRHYPRCGSGEELSSWFRYGFLGQPNDAYHDCHGIDWILHLSLDTN